MADPLRIELSITPPGETLPLEQAYQERAEQALLDRHYRAINLDPESARMEDAAAGGEAMQARRGVQAPQESTSEVLRERATQAMQAPASRTAISGVVKTLIGASLDDLQKAVETGALPESVSLKLLDPVGSTVEELAKGEAKKAGLPDESVATIGTISGLLAGVLFPAGVGKRAGKAVEQAKELRRLGAEQRETLRKFLAGEIPEIPARVNVARIGGGLPQRGGEEGVQRTAAALNRLHANRLAGSREGVTHAETILKSKGALSLEEALRLSENDLILDKNKGTALRDLYNTASTRLDQLRGRVVSGEQGLDDDLAMTFLIASELAVKDELAGRGVARALEARKILSEAGRGANLTMQDIALLSARFVGADFPDTMTLAQMLTTLRRAERASLLAHVGAAARAGQNAIYELWINALLTGPQTHAANTLSNAITTAWAPTERALSAMLDMGRDRSVFLGESAAMLSAIPAATADAFRLAGRALREGRSPMGAEKVERIGAISAETFGVNPESALGGFVDFMGALIRTPGRALMTEDAFFKGFNYRLELHAQAYRAASQEGLRGSERATRMRAIIEQPPAAIKARAENFAAVQTFTRDLDELGAIGGVAGGIAKAADSVPMGRVVAPFISTPANILHFASERTPILNALSDTLWADIRAGGERRALAVGKVATSAMLGGAVAALAGAGVITGAGPKDPASQQLLRATGWQPYSVKIGDMWYSYNRLDPLGMTLGILADYGEIAGEIPAGRRAELVAGIGLAVSRHLLHKTYMQGVADLFEALQAPENRLDDYLHRLARTIVPTGVRQVARALDPTLRETRALEEAQAVLNEIRAGVPGYSSTLPPRRNLWGDPIVLQGGWGPDLISPIYTSKPESDPVTEEIIKQKVKLALPRPIAFGGSEPSETFQMKSPRPAVEGVPLTPGEYDRLLVLTGKGVAGAPPLKDALATMIHGDEYRHQSGGPDGGKALMIQSLVGAYKQAARAALTQESPGLVEALGQKIGAKAKALTPPAQLPQTLGR